MTVVVKCLVIENRLRFHSTDHNECSPNMHSLHARILQRYRTPLPLVVALANPLALVPLTPLAATFATPPPLPLDPPAPAPALLPAGAGVENLDVAAEPLTEEAGGFSTNDVSVVLSARQLGFSCKKAWETPYRKV